MTKVKSCHLLDMLAKVEDPRKKKGKQAGLFNFTVFLTPTK